MRIFQDFSREFISILLASIFFIFYIFTSSAVFSQELNSSADVSHLSKAFSEKFCLQIANGLNPEDAGKIASKEMVRGLILSPIIKEIMTIPKEELASSLSKDIFDGCKDDLNVSEQELYEYLVKLAGRDRQQSPPKPFKPFGLG